MIVDELRVKEPIAYQSLFNALKNNKVAHCYLFSGEYSPLKLDVAYLLAQSIIENKNDFACETCNTCKRIKEDKYFDLIHIDGYDESIKKDDIERIMDEFSRTALEAAGKKICILSNINNASPKVLNMILKFMEEPSNDTYFILITDKKEDILPTIVSRCEEIPFLTRDFSYLIEKYLNAGFEYEDAYLLANILHKYDPEFDLNDPYYINAKEYVYKTIDTLKDKDYLPVMFYKEFYTTFKEKDKFKKCVDYYLAIMIKMLEDTLENRTIDDDQYNNYLKKLSKYDVGKLLEIFIEASDKTLMNAERKLLFDGIACQIISYI